MLLSHHTWINQLVSIYAEWKFYLSIMWPCLEVSSIYYKSLPRFWFKWLCYDLRLKYVDEKPKNKQHNNQLPITGFYANNNKYRPCHAANTMYWNLRHEFYKRTIAYRPIPFTLSILGFQRVCSYILSTFNLTRAQSLKKHYIFNADSWSSRNFLRSTAVSCCTLGWF
jgi:hypothetical protein